MSNRRRSLGAMAYREYLQSPVWFARRDRWFTDHARTHRPLTCTVCGRGATKGELQLHHLDYHWAIIRDGRFLAREAHEDLTPMHATCHELVHQLIDRDRVLAFHRTRRDATLIAIAQLHRASDNEEAS
jgi:5-methylcytosine-specific restriction protein A